MLLLSWMVIWRPLLPWLQACSCTAGSSVEGLWRQGCSSREEEGGTWELYHSNILTKSNFFSKPQTAALNKLPIICLLSFVMAMEPGCGKTETRLSFWVCFALKSVSLWCFFSLFERVANECNWPDSACKLMLQCVLQGTAQSLTHVDSQKYLSWGWLCWRFVSWSQFRTLKKGEKQSHLRFACDMTSHFTHWYSAKGAADFEERCELIVLEQFQKDVPVCVSMTISEQKAGSLGLSLTFIKRDISKPVHHLKSCH